MTTNPDAEDRDRSQLIERLIDRATASQVFGQPVTHDSVTVLPVAQIGIGAGGGFGAGPEQSGEKASGVGGGYGATARPVGAFAITDGNVRWVPVVDYTRLGIAAACAAVAIALVVRRRRVRD